MSDEEAEITELLYQNRVVSAVDRLIVLRIGALRSGLTNLRDHWDEYAEMPMTRSSVNNSAGQLKALAALLRQQADRIDEQLAATEKEYGGEYKLRDIDKKYLPQQDPTHDGPAQIAQDSPGQPGTDGCTRSPTWQDRVT